MLAYLAVPYSHKDPQVQQHRFGTVCHAAYRLMKLGYAVFSPISHSHPIEVLADVVENWDFWQKQDLPILEKCDLLVVLKLDGWEESKGVAAEIAFAKEKGIPVHFVEWRDGDIHPRMITAKHKPTPFEEGAKVIAAAVDKTLLEKAEEFLVAKRANKGKPELSYILEFPRAIEALARVMEYGAHKYGDMNYAIGGKPDREYLSAELRHFSQFKLGDEYDDESKCLHLAHRLWNVLTMLELNYGDRPAITKGFREACEEAKKKREENDRAG